MVNIFSQHFRTHIEKGRLTYWHICLDERVSTFCTLAVFGRVCLTVCSCVRQSDPESAESRLSPPAEGGCTGREEAAPPLCPSNTSREELAVVQVGAGSTEVG